VIPVRVCNGLVAFCPMAHMRVALVGVAIHNRLDQCPAYRARQAW
jgi:hypothetical protein